MAEMWPEGDLANKVNPAVKAEVEAPVERGRRSNFFQIGLLAMIVAFGALMVLASMAPFFAVDLSITRSIQQLNSQLFNGLMVVVSWVGFPPQSMIITGLIVAVLFGLGLRWESLFTLASAAAVTATDLIVKVAVHRARPPTDLVHVVKVLNSYSFPSGHVSFYTATFGFLWYLTYTLLKPSWKRSLLLVIFGGLVLLVGISRIYLGQHWASDVVGAYLLGSLVLAGIIQLYRLRRKNRPKEPA